MAAGVAGIEVVPVLHPLFGWVPAEEDDSAFALVREVEQTHIQVFEDDAKLRCALSPGRDCTPLRRTPNPPFRRRCRLRPQDRFHVRGLFAQGVAVERGFVRISQAG